MIIEGKNLSLTKNVPAKKSWTNPVIFKTSWILISIFLDGVFLCGVFLCIKFPNQKLEVKNRRYLIRQLHEQLYLILSGKFTNNLFNLIRQIHEQFISSYQANSRTISSLILEVMNKTSSILILIFLDGAFLDRHF